VPKRAAPYNGLLIVDKPGHPSSDYLPTSHDVVASVRQWSGQRRIGHTGTLDPMASGVLALCLGRATRLVEYYQGHDKVYLADVTLGSATDTYDALGQVTDHAPVPDLDVAALEEALNSFRGEITQTPPAFSAIKVQGEALHRKARRGEDVQPPTRQVTLHRLELLDYSPGHYIRLRVSCSAGAYLRSLAHDLGIALGTYAHLSGLRREAAGPFTLAEAHTLSEIESSAEDGHLGALLVPMGTGLDMPRLPIDDAGLLRFGYGQQVALPEEIWHDAAENCAEAISPLDAKADMLAQAIEPDGTLAGIIRRIGPAEDDQGAHSGASVWRAVKWLRK
jgi:tRNA pseudouridine55 synthase